MTQDHEYLEIDVDEKPTDVVVYFESCSAEPDIGWYGGLDIESIVLDGTDTSLECLIGKMTKEEVETVHQKLSEILTDRNDPENSL
jgi:hypothetical protein